jgi:hypothetical protein
MLLGATRVRTRVSYIYIVYTALAGLLNICSNLGTLAKHLADHCGQDDEWYHDNAKYKAVFQNRLREAVDAGTPILDINSFLSRILSPAILSLSRCCLGQTR